MGPHPATAPRGSTADTLAPGQAAPPDAVVLTSDIIELPAAASFDDAGFHAPVLIQTRIPTDAPAQAGGRIVLVRRDDGRPRQTCGSQHPLSVCATLDWSDFPDRPGVSPSGMLENRLRLPVVAGTLDLSLSETGALTGEPDPSAPG